MTGLRMLARRELFASQLRERLTRKGFDDADVEETLARLQDDGSLDNQRAAAAFAHDAATLKKWSPHRTRRELIRHGVASADTEHAVTGAYAEVSERSLVEDAVRRRQSGPIITPAEFGRLFRKLERQGFDRDLIGDVLRRLQ